MIWYNSQHEWRKRGHQLTAGWLIDRVASLPYCAEGKKLAGFDRNRTLTLAFYNVGKKPMAANVLGSEIWYTDKGQRHSEKVLLW